jgi:hypothetical protein
MDQEKFNSQLQIIAGAVASMRPEFAGSMFLHPCLNEDTSTTDFDTHYLYHVAWAISKVAKSKPGHHVDFSSSLNFCTAIASICRTTFYDFRPAKIQMNNLECKACDLSDSAFQEGPFDSVSCMHVIEHIGLGRYGDPLDVNGDLKAITNLKRSVKQGGSLYFVVPCGRPAIHFNAHRIYSAQTIIDYFSDEFSLLEHYFIPGPIDQAPMLNPSIEVTLNYPYGCGCFHFRKK